ncbi:ATP-binding cassette domain-containing protein [Vreelandella azerica]|uniref:ATP-binding cassette domain-containing protein n=1 Tax=Vreelandella azerica TaxID=2732867 RepID=UPI001C118AEF|nr:ATP-binding cassette domain-containing protein [Halomonas azerica]
MSDQVKVSIQHLYKIFGNDPLTALEHVKAGMDKSTLLEEHGHVLGLQDINVDILAGKITVIMGLSGSGKSTLIRHLNRLIDPTDGAVLVDGDDIVGYDEQALRELRRNKMSMVFQKFALLPHRTVLENAATPMLVCGKKPADAKRKAPNGWPVSACRVMKTNTPTSFPAACNSASGLPVR